MKYKLLVLLSIFLFLISCTPANPVFDFDFSNEKSNLSLEISSDVQVLNSINLAKVTLSGSCEKNTTLKLIKPVAFQSEITCENGSFTRNLDLSSLNDGDVDIEIEVRNAFGDYFLAKKKLLKDFVLPQISIFQPSSIGGSDKYVPLSGSCSEEGEAVVVNETITGKSQSTSCHGGLWEMQFALGEDLSSQSYEFKSKHMDKVKNLKVSDAKTVNRTSIGDFSIQGVSHLSDNVFTSVLNGNFNNYYVKWTLATGASNYSLKIFKFNKDSLQYDNLICSKSNMSAATDLLNVNTCSLLAGTLYQVQVIATDNKNQESFRSLNFSTKALPILKRDALVLYILSDFDSPAATPIYYSDLIENHTADDSPYILTLVSIDAGLSSSHSIDNANQKLIITPEVKLSGKYNVSYQIQDKYGNISIAEGVDYYLAMPHSWAGLVDNDFNKAANWCGTVSLKGGCLGALEPPSFSKKIMIDELCSNPTGQLEPATYCSPTLTAPGQVHSFYLKTNSFDQNGYDFTVGDENGVLTGFYMNNKSFFRQTGGVFNSENNSSFGNLFILNVFSHLGGQFYAPRNSNFIISSKYTSIGTNVVSIWSATNFYHNQSHLVMNDPQGTDGSVIFQAPENLELYKVTFNTDGGGWKFKSNNIIIHGDLNLSGRIRLANYPRMLSFDSSSKLTLKGNLLCSGANKGGSLPIYIMGPQSSTYKVSHSDCKFPPLVLSGTSALLSEDGTSSYDLMLQALIVNSGNTFVAPGAGKRIVLSPDMILNNAFAFDIQGSFSHNSGTVEFQNFAFSSQIFKINIGVNSFYKLIFSNYIAASSAFLLQNNFVTQFLEFAGSDWVRLQGNLFKITTDNVKFYKGLYQDSLNLNKIVISGAGGTDLEVNTLDRINVPNIEINRNINLSGSVSTFNFSGTNFYINTYNLYVPGGYTFWYNMLFSSGGSLQGTGAVSSGNL